MIDLKARLTSAMTALISDTGITPPFEAVFTDSSGYILGMRYEDGQVPEKTCESTPGAGDVTFPVDLHLFDSTGDMVRRVKFVY